MLVALVVQLSRVDFDASEIIQTIREVQLEAGKYIKKVGGLALSERTELTRLIALRSCSGHHSTEYATRSHVRRDLKLGEPRYQCAEGVNADVAAPRCAECDGQSTYRLETVPTPSVSVAIGAYNACITSPVDSYGAVIAPLRGVRSTELVSQGLHQRHGLAESSRFLASAAGH